MLVLGLYRLLLLSGILAAASVIHTAFTGLVLIASVMAGVAGAQCGATAKGSPAVYR